MTATTPTPRISVVVRSYKRLPTLAKLLRILLAQEHDSFEVVVVEQTPERDPTDWAVIQELATDSRIVLLERPPLGGAGARNEGVTHSRGDIIIFIDDDDLPVGTRWIQTFEDHYRKDPGLVGVTARLVAYEGEPCPYGPLKKEIARRMCMSYTPLKTPVQMALFDEDVEVVDWLHGSNVSVKREVALKVGLWDTNTPSQDEHSFAFKLARVIEPGQHLGYRAIPTAIRGLDIPGGMDKRFRPVEKYLDAETHFYMNIVGKHFPELLDKYTPMYAGWITAKTLAWVWFDAKQDKGVSGNLESSLKVLRAAPSLLRKLRR